MRTLAPLLRPMAATAALLVFVTAATAAQPAPTQQPAQPSAQGQHMQPGAPMYPGGPAWPGAMQQRPANPGMMQPPQQGQQSGPGMYYRGPQGGPGMMPPQMPQQGQGGPGMMQGPMHPGMHQQGGPGPMQGQAPQNGPDMSQGPMMHHGPMGGPGMHHGPMGGPMMDGPMMDGPMMGGPMMGGPMMGGMCPMGGPFAEGRLAFLKAELGIKDNQQAAFDALAKVVKSHAEGRDDRRTAMMETMQKAQTPLDRLGARITMMEMRAAMMKEMKGALDGLYGVLDDEQKRKADFLLPGVGGMRCMM